MAPRCPALACAAARPSLSCALRGHLASFDATTVPGSSEIAQHCVVNSSLCWSTDAPPVRSEPSTAAPPPSRSSTRVCGALTQMSPRPTRLTGALTQRDNPIAASGATAGSCPSTAARFRAALDNPTPGPRRASSFFLTQVGFVRARVPYSPQLRPTPRIGVEMCAAINADHAAAAANEDSSALLSRSARWHISSTLRCCVNDEPGVESSETTSSVAVQQA